MGLFIAKLTHCYEPGLLTQGVALKHKSDWEIWSFPSVSMFSYFFPKLQQWYNEPDSNKAFKSLLNNSWKLSWASRWLNDTPSFIKSIFVTHGEENAKYTCVGVESQTQNEKESWLDLSLSFYFSSWTSSPSHGPLHPASFFCHNPPFPCWAVSCVAHLREQAGGGWRLRGDLLLCRDFTKLPKLIFFLCTFEKSNIVQKVNITSWHRSPKPRKNVPY